MNKQETKLNQLQTNQRKITYLLRAFKGIKMTACWLWYRMVAQEALFPVSFTSSSALRRSVPLPVYSALQGQTQPWTSSSSQSNLVPHASGRLWRLRTHLCCLTDHPIMHPLSLSSDCSSLRAETINSETPGLHILHAIKLAPNQSLGKQGAIYSPIHLQSWCINR